jgi:hypothetical protein
MFTMNFIYAKYLFILAILSCQVSSSHSQEVFGDIAVCHDAGRRLQCVTGIGMLLRFEDARLKTAMFGDSLFLYDPQARRVTATLFPLAIKLTEEGPVLENDGKEKKLGSLDLSKVVASCEGVGIVNTRAYFGDLELSYLYEDCKIKSVDIITGDQTLSIRILRVKQNFDWEISWLKNGSLQCDIDLHSISIYNDIKGAGIGLSSDKGKIEKLSFFTFSLSERRITDWADRKIFYNKEGRISKKTIYQTRPCHCD